MYYKRAARATKLPALLPSRAVLCTRLAQSPASTGAVRDESELSVRRPRGRNAATQE